MIGYIYLPVVDAEMLQMAADWNAGRIAKGKQPYQVIKNQGHFGRGKLLANINVYDKVYVLLHGGGQLSSKVGASGKSFTPRELARHLKNAGLKQLFARDLRIFACGSGGHGTLTEADGTSSYVPPFVRELRDEMTLLGYYRLAVYGYTASVYTKYDDVYLDDGTNIGQYKTAVSGLHGLVRASDARIVFYGPLRTETDSQLPNQVHLGHAGH